MSAYYASPGSPAAATVQEELAPVLVAFAGPASQSRLTVLIRALMVIPHIVVLWALAIAAYVVVIIGWFGALFTGRLPGFAADFLTGFVRWQARVFGYAILLTDVYPPFTMEDADYPVRVAVRPGRLNRLAVLFRFFLMLPAWIVAAVVGYGAFTLVQFVSWLIVLISGQMPDALYQALAAALRYQIRVSGFAFMLTSAYPSGLYGDRVAAGTAGPQPGFGGQPSYGAQPGYGQQPGYGAPPVVTGLGSWWLALSSKAKTLVTMFIVLGVVFAAAEGFVQAAFTNNVVGTAEAVNQLQSDFTPVNTAVNGIPAKVKACNGQLACVTQLDRSVAGTLNTFAAQVRGIAMPSGQAISDAADLASATSHTAGIFAALGTATSVSRYQSIGNADSNDLQQSLEQIYTDYNTLGTALTNS
jgi:Domain of unknown function (DUF4389)